MTLTCLLHRTDNLVQRVIPGNPAKLPGTFFTDTLQGMGQTIRMMLAFRISGDLRTDDARRIIIVRRPMHTTDRLFIDHFNIESTGGRAVMWTDGSRRFANISGHNQLASECIKG